METIRLDLFPALAPVLAGVLGVLALLSVGGLARPASRIVAIALATLLAILFLSDSHVTTQTLLWVGLVLIGAALLATGSPSSAVAWLRLVVIGAPLLWLVDSLLVGSSGGALLAVHPLPRGVVPLLIVVGAASAGLTPLTGWSGSRDGRGFAALVSDGLGPLVGFAFAARAVAAEGGRPTLVVIVLLVFAGCWGLATIVVGRWSETEISGPGRAAAGLAFLLLAIATSWAALLGLLLVAGGAAIQLLPRPPARRSRVAQPSHPAPREGRADVFTFVAQLVADPARYVEGRYDLAIGLLVTLLILFAFVG